MQPLKALLPIDVADVADKSTEVNPVHPDNAELPILISDAGNVMAVKEVLLRNEFNANESTVAGTTNVVAFPLGN